MSMWIDSSQGRMMGVSNCSYLFAGGGTGGHLTPGFAVADELRAIDPGCHIVFAGSERPMERELVARQGYKHVALPVESSRTLWRNPLQFLRRNWRAMRLAGRLLAELRPQAVIGLGGFASAPLIWKATGRGIPTVLLEQNTIPGRVTRWLSRRADRVCVSFEESRNWLSRAANVVVTGNPVRREIAELRGRTVDRSKGTTPGHQTLLILGGSQGSQHLNAAVTAMVGQSPLQFTGWHIVHQTGSEQQEMVREEYVRLGVTATVAAFFDDMAERYAQATLAICRAGATTLAELACAGCPAILVPFPHAADNHQLRNAQAFRDAGAALLAEQGGDATETGRRLADGVQQVLREEGPLTRMSHAMQALSRPDAAQKVVAELQSLARGM